jgi:cyanate lyase
MATVLKRQEVTEQILAAKKAQNVKWEDLAKKLNCSPVWLCSVCLGENSMEQGMAEKLISLLQLPADYANVLTEFPTKAQYDWNQLRQDPVINRLHEINIVYARSIKEMIKEKFGDGVMSAICLNIDVDKNQTENGDFVKITLNGKFLPFTRF